MRNSELLSESGWTNAANHRAAEATVSIRL